VARIEHGGAEAAIDLSLPRPAALGS